MEEKEITEEMSYETMKDLLLSILNNEMYQNFLEFNYKAMWDKVYKHVETKFSDRKKIRYHTTAIVSNIIMHTQGTTLHVLNFG